MTQRIVIPGFRKIETSGGGEGTGNYNDLTNKPSINNVPLVGNLKTVDLKLTDTTLTEDISFTENVKIGTIYAHKNGNCVTITSWSQATQDLGTSNLYATIAILPKQYIPNYSSLTYCCINNDILCQVIVGDDGLIKIGYSLSLTNNSSCDIPNGTSIYFATTYVI